MGQPRKIGRHSAKPPVKTAYALAITLSAVLLFSVEPIATRALLPVLGGSAAVWITALAFFQLTLFLGYAYSHGLSTAGVRARPVIALHLALLALATLLLWLPGQFSASVWAGRYPQWTAFAQLARLVGLPFFVLSSTAPLLQVWYARRERTAVPYRLFALSNFASLATLLAYPLLIEPHLGLRRQIAVWRAGFVLYAVLLAWLTLRMRSAQPALLSPPPAPRATHLVRPWALWLALPAVASLQLAAVTEHLTQNVAAMPLLWMLPLAAYLLSFVVAFEFPRLYNRSFTMRLLAVLLLALGYFLAQAGATVPLSLSVPLFTAELFLACWFCHAELFQLRPSHAADSSMYYVSIAGGGALGTLAVAILSPLLTDANFDLPFAFLLTAALALWISWREGWPYRLLWGIGALLGVVLLAVLHAASLHDSLFRSRNFYGSLRVSQSQYPPQAFLSRSLYNGTIQHGMQWFSTDFLHTPLTYYAPDSGVGLALTHCCAGGQPRHIGVIGLGAGTLAAYGRPGDTLRFYEINPAVIDVAGTLFTYTRGTSATLSVVPGDARLSLAAEHGGPLYDVLVIDAFSGDSIPVHLLTREALALYRRHLTPGGILAFHISNQYLDLAPVLARLAQPRMMDSDPGLHALEIDSAPDAARGEALASWVLLTADPGILQQPALANAGHAIHVQTNVRSWTDDNYSLLPILRWSGRATVVTR